MSIYGPPGPGKTLTTRRVCCEFAARHEQAAVHELDGSYNLGTREAYDFDTVVELLTDDLGTDVEPVFVANPVPESVSVYDTCADASTIGEGTGWEPRIDFGEDIRRVCAKDNDE